MQATIACQTNGISLHCNNSLFNNGGAIVTASAFHPLQRGFVVDLHGYLESLWFSSR